MKKFFNPALASCLLATSTLGTSVAFAAPVEPEPNHAVTPATANLTLSDPGTIVPPNPDVEQNTPIQGHFGIAYAPKALTATGKLNKTGEQEITLSNSAHTDVSQFDVAVRDTLRTTNTWELSARLLWQGANASLMDGTSIKGTNGQVKLNIGDTDNNGKGDLVDLPDPAEVTTPASTLEITDTATPILRTVSGKQINGIYNYSFESPKLTIPAVEKVPAGQYQGEITWNLTKSPTQS